MGEAVLVDVLLLAAGQQLDAAVTVAGWALLTWTIVACVVGAVTWGCCRG